MIEKIPGLSFLFHTLSFNDNSNTLSSPIGFLYNIFEQIRREKRCCDSNSRVEISLNDKGYTWSLVRLIFLKQSSYHK